MMYDDYYESVSVWDKLVNGWGETTWRLFATTHRVGTPEEKRYFRVVRDGAKHFFHGPAAYIEFAGGMQAFDEESIENLRPLLINWNADGGESNPTTPVVGE